MHVCIFGTGAAGWMVAHSLKNLEEVTKITIIGSDEIPSIGVGESTTLKFVQWMSENLHFNTSQLFNFIKDINASIKYGVSYEGWSSKNFLHGFNNDKNPILNRNKFLISNKPKEDNVNIYNSYISSFAYENKILLDWFFQPLSWQFEANSLINTLNKMSELESKIVKKINTLEGVVYKNDDNEFIEYVLLKNKEKIKADYYVNAIGSTSFNQDIFKEKYKWYDNILLTNKAIFAPIEYTNKQKEIHPYTVAKAMKNGWRWITPTWNRIGTGYVFSDKYCSIEEAKEELANDIGKNLEFTVVDFTPRKVEKSYKENYCNIGMAAGFLEPLDAPGLAITIESINLLKDLIKNFKSKNYKNMLLQKNKYSDNLFDFWASFILLQYKTSDRDDTDFWKDHKKIKFQPFEELYSKISNVNYKEAEIGMFLNTIAGKDINWRIGSKEKPIKLNNSTLENIDHLKFLTLIREENDLLKLIYDLYSKLYNGNS